MRAFLLIEVEPLAVVATHAFALDNLRTADRAPFARLLADLARVALGPPFDPKHRQVRDQPQRRADGTAKAAIQIPDDVHDGDQLVLEEPHVTNGQHKCRRTSA